MSAVKRCIGINRSTKTSCSYYKNLNENGLCHKHHAELEAGNLTGVIEGHKMPVSHAKKLEAELLTVVNRLERVEQKVKVMGKQVVDRLERVEENVEMVEQKVEDHESLAYCVGSFISQFMVGTVTTRVKPIHRLSIKAIEFRPRREIWWERQREAREQKINAKRLRYLA